MIRCTNNKGRPIKVGDMVQIEVDKVNLLKTDCKNLALLVIEGVSFVKGSLMH